MLDIELIRQNSKKVKKGVIAKGYNGDLVDKVLVIDKNRREAIIKRDLLRQKRNEAAEARDQEVGKGIKKELEILEYQLKSIEDNYQSLLSQIPNLPADDVPVGKDESDNKTIKKEGGPTKFEFKPLDHLELGEKLDILDFERGSKVAGSGFYYLKNEGALLDLALVQYGMEFLRKKNYIPVITPDLAHEKFYIGTGYLPKGPEAQTYTITNSDLGLVATAEVTLAGLHSDEILTERGLPKKYAGYSHCFRVEAGGYGKYSKGLYRVHQFTKVEMYIYSLPGESVKIHEEILQIEEEFWQSLEIPYQVVEMCTGDLGAQATKKYDLEAWMPGRDDWGEVTSCSNTTDYQARRLGIKYSSGSGNEFTHTLNGTLVATSRAIIAILENFQQKDGSVKIPKVLQKYTGFSVIKPKK